MATSLPPSNGRGATRASTRQFQFTCRGLLLLLALCSVACAILFRVLLPEVEAARQRECASKLKRIGIALENYRVVYGCFPAPYIPDAAGKPMTSWRTALYPYLDDACGPQKYDYRLPWNAPANLATTSPARADFGYRCPSASDRQPLTSTNYVMIVGPKSAWRAGQWTTGESITDVRANTVVIAEIADSDIHWTEPRDLSLDEMSLRINDKSKPGISSHHLHGAMVLFADGRARFLDASTTPDQLWAMLTSDSND